MQVLSKAIQLFNEKKYEKALPLFREAEKIYGTKIVQYHIDKCCSYLNVSVNEDLIFNPISKNKAELDSATKILLHNSGDPAYKLDAKEYEDILSQWQKVTSVKSRDVETKIVNPIPKDWPKDLVLAPLPEGPNDYVWHRKNKQEQRLSSAKTLGLSVIIPTFNRSWILDITLACLVNQKTEYPFEVIVADDGSKEQIIDVVKKYEALLDIKFVRQKDYGYQLCAVRNLGIRTAKYSYVSILDCDMAPNIYWVDSYMSALVLDDSTAYIGPRKYIDTHGYSGRDFISDVSLIMNMPETLTNNTIASSQTAVSSIDWRLEHFRKTDNLRLCDSPFRYFSGGNVAFAKKWIEKVGEFDEEFTHWGGEDNEFGYRLFKAGCFFQSLDGAMAYHQEPPGKENETDRDAGKKKTIKIVQEKVPYIYRKITTIEHARLHVVPLVTIYIPAYNCSDSIERCINSALNQTITDLEVCVCDDGSTDNTLELLRDRYGDNPRVKIITKENGGIASASNYAVREASGYYIGQLDSDDYLEPDAVEICLREFLKNKKLACVYTTNRNVNPDGSLIANGYNWPEFSREKFTTAMIVHHFRMFTIRAWNLTSGFNEKITNAVDYDIYLKLSEVGEFKHINKICYNRVLHGENTSIKKLGLQKQNHFKVVNDALNRQGIKQYTYESANHTDDASRSYLFEKNI